MADAGLLSRLAHGYYAIVPEQVRHLGGWRPTIEGVALGIAQVDYGPEGAALMGISAARLLGAIPRAVATAVVAVPKQRPHLETTAGRVVFVTRTVARLATQQATTDLADGWVTDVDQTLLDLADRPTLGDLGASDVDAAIHWLQQRANHVRVDELGARQRKRAAARAAFAPGAG